MGGLLRADGSRFRVRRMTVDIPDLPPALEGFTITHVSDIHLGRLTADAV